MRVKNSSVYILGFFCDSVFNSQVEHCAFQAVRYKVEWMYMELKQGLGIFVFIVR